MDRVVKTVKHVVVLGVVIFATFGFCVAIVEVFDNYFNRVVCDSIYRLFMHERTDWVNGNPVVYYEPYWPELKTFLIVIFFLLVFLLVFSGWLAATVASRSQKRKLGQELLRVKAENQRHEGLLQAEAQQKNDLITYLAHDLKTPLASVIGYLSLLDETPDIPAPQREKYTRVALDKAFRLEQLIYEFFDITRFNLQKIVLNKGTVHLSLLLEQMAEEFFPMVEPDQKRIVVETEEDLTYWGDGDKLARVFNNVLKNAVAYSYEGTEIRVEAHRERGSSREGILRTGLWKKDFPGADTISEAGSGGPDCVVVSCTNQGDPIPEQKLQTIFEKFYRLDTSRSSRTGGSGLGLAIAREIVEAHGGAIWVTSSRERTVFTVTLPIKERGDA